jgi:hypothetical protein
MRTTPDSTLANSDRVIAGLQRQLAERAAELAECQAERDQGLQRETATTEVLQVINSSPGESAAKYIRLIHRSATSKTC